MAFGAEVRRPGDRVGSRVDVRQVDGHVDAQGLQLAEVAADPAVASCLLVVPAGAEVGEPGRGVGQEVEMMTRMDLPTAHMALVPSRRRVNRRSRSPREVSVFPVPLAAWAQYVFK